MDGDLYFDSKIQVQNEMGRIFKKKLNLKQRFEKYASLFDAIDELNKLGYTHNDIKPQNIMMRNLNNPSQLELVFIDFGASERVSHGKMFQIDSEVMSTIYMNPQFNYYTKNFFNFTFDGRIKNDVYSLIYSILALELITDRRDFANV